MNAGKIHRNSDTHEDEEKVVVHDPNDKSKCCYDHYAMKTKVGVVPFNPNKVNQDRAMIIHELFGNKEQACFAVFDGHGMHGDDSSSFLANNLPKIIEKNKNFAKDPKKGLIDACDEITKLLKSSQVNCTFSGSTGVIVYMDMHKIYCANVGDSRAVLGREINNKILSIPLSFDHKPDNPNEKQRIEKKNGRVESCKGSMGENIGPARVWLKNQDMPGLAMSRSFGDDIATSVGVNSEPEIIVHDRTDKDKFIILGSDGIWEFISNDEMANIVYEFNNDANKACKAIVKESTKKWQMEEDVIDDITVIVIYL
jgi:serine/threonine protein phosphatase PrpC